MKRDRRDDVHRLVLAHMPGYQVHSVTELGRGLDNHAFEVNRELVVRFREAKLGESRADLVRREAAVLVEVARFAPIPVPVPVFVDEEAGCLAYFELPGEPLVNVEGLARASLQAVASTLGRFLGALHDWPMTTVSALVNTDAEPLEAWRADAGDGYTRVVDHVPAELRPRIEAFVDQCPPAGEWTLVFSHNDLGIEHVLVEPVRPFVTGIIDWSDAALVDPAYDFGLLLRDLGPAALDVALASYRGGVDLPALTARAWFYARCSVIEDLDYNIEQRADRHLRKSVSSLDWLFRATA